MHSSHGPRLLPTVQTLQDANSWAEHYLAVTLRWLDDLGIPHRCLVETAGELSVSSAFSGIGGFEQTWALCAGALGAFVRGDQRTAGPARNLFSIEHNDDCRYELSMLPNPPACQFVDMCDAINERIKPVLDGQAARMPYQYLKQNFMKPNAVGNTMRCVVHNRRCVVRRARIHWASTPCIIISAG